ncbi:kynurenine 3-monooxygenase-like [Oscarella lobularis]|uniref:kynurenine 3-monooxygenase-like n=1 Tax=Oscarella lobularis TaxID=121494 RepID=UPI00331313FA
MFSERSRSEGKSVAIVGAGLVGSLCSVILSKKGYSVTLYESRSDLRESGESAGRSINLALSERGRTALRLAGAEIETEIVDQAIPMYGRMLHSYTGEKTFVPYGKGDQCILSIDRRKLNETLLSKAERSNVTLKFLHKLTSLELDTGKMDFKLSDGSEVKDVADLVVGADGAYSAVRKCFMRKLRFNYSQEYIPHAYKELVMPSNPDGSYKMETNYLHIWPRHTFMLIALPNPDGTFTCTLFMPLDKFDTIDVDSEDDIIRFFESEFPDSVELFGRNELVTQYQTNPVSHLPSIKCFPYHSGSKAVIIGDAAHAMVPFYGQGMNAGFEDCTVLVGLLEKHLWNVGSALEEYSDTRYPDATAICDLAMYNYVEMRSHVLSTTFLMRKKVDGFLNWLMPRTFIPLYTMVAFTNIPYHTVVLRREWQDKVIGRCVWIFGLASVAGSVTIAAMIAKKLMT